MLTWLLEVQSFSSTKSHCALCEVLILKTAQSRDFRDTRQELRKRVQALQRPNQVPQSLQPAGITAAPSHDQVARFFPRSNLQDQLSRGSISLTFVPRDTTLVSTRFPA